MIDAKLQYYSEALSGMSNIQLYFAIGLPCFTILASLIVNILTVSGIREDIRAIRSDLKNIVGGLNELDKRGSR